MIAHGAIHQAIKAHGVFVRITPEDFMNLLKRSQDLMVVTSKGGLFSNYHVYITSNKGLGFHCKSKQPIVIPSAHETLQAISADIPEMENGVAL